MLVPKGTVIEAVCKGAIFAPDVWKNVSKPLEIGDLVTVPEYPEWVCEIEYRGLVDDKFIVCCDHGEYVAVNDVSRTAPELYKARVDGLFIHDGLVKDNIIKIVEIPLIVGQIRVDHLGYGYKVLSIYEDRVVLRTVLHDQTILYMKDDFVARYDEVVKYPLTFTS